MQKEPQDARAKAQMEKITGLSQGRVLQDRENKLKLTKISARTSGTRQAPTNHF